MSGRAVALDKCRVQTAVASRVVGIFEEMETMCAEPVGVRCVRVGGGVDIEDGNGWAVGNDEDVAGRDEYEEDLLE